MTKFCNSCETYKDIELFPKLDTSFDGRRARCTECASNKRKEDSERYRNKKSVKLKQKSYYKENKDKINNRQRLYNKTDSGRQADRIASAKRRALKLSTEDGSITKQSLQELRELQNNKCYYCECELDFKGKNKVHLDHHIPLSKGGPHSISNVKYTCRKCNLSKQAGMPTTLLLIFGEQS